MRENGRLRTKRGVRAKKERYFCRSFLLSIRDMKFAFEGGLENSGKIYSGVFRFVIKPGRNGAVFLDGSQIVFSSILSEININEGNDRAGGSGCLNIRKT